MKKIRKQIIFALLAIVLALAGVEGASRFYDWLKDDYLKKVGEETLAFNGKDLNPYVFFRSLPSLELRPHGAFFFEFNGKTVQARKEPREYRIFILGGSVAQGYGASSSENHFYHLLEKKLNDAEYKNRRSNVISAGRLGYVSAQELILLMMGILDFKPDLVLHLNGANDILAVLQYQEPPGYPFYFQTLNRALEAVKIGKLIDQSLNRSAFLEDLQNMFKKYRSPTDSLTAKNIARHYMRNMRQSAQLLKANKIVGVFILQPILFGKKVKGPQEQEQFKQSYAQNLQFWGSTYPLLAQSLRQISNQENIVSENLQGAFDNVKGSVFRDSVHLNDQGQKLLADALFDIIQKNSLLKTQN